MALSKYLTLGLKAVPVIAIRYHLFVRCAFQEAGLTRSIWIKASPAGRTEIESGADYIMTPVYDKELIARIAEATKHLQVPIFIGVMPLASGRNAEYLHNEVPGIQLSDEVRKRMAGLEGEAGRAEGVRIAGGSSNRRWNISKAST